MSLVLNIEEGFERAVSRGNPRNEPVYDMIEEIDGQPNLTMESHFDYGTRAGYWRIMRRASRTLQLPEALIPWHEIPCLSAEACDRARLTDTLAHPPVVGCGADGASRACSRPA